MAITAKMVSELRERSGAAMMECKKALTETGGDVEAAVDFLRKSGLKGAEKRAGRDMAEGRVGVHIADGGRAGSIVALTSETDFVARTDDFAALLVDLCKHVTEHNPDNAAAMLDQPLAGRDAAVGVAIKSLSGKLGENMQVAQLQRYENEAGCVGSYVHHDGKSGALISVTTKAPVADATAFLKNLGMHIAAIRPAALSREDIAADVVERERKIIMESEEMLSKPEDKREMIAKGKLEKFYAGSALLEQPWVLDPKTTVKKALAAALGDDAKIEAYSLFLVG